MSTQTIIAFLFGVVFIIALIALAVIFPNPTPFQYRVFRIVLSLAAAGVAAMIPGFINLQLKPATQIAIQAGGALAVFVIVYLLDPPQLIVGEKERLEEEPVVTGPITGEILSGDQVFARNYSHLKGGRKEKARLLFESLKSIASLEVRYLMGDEPSTRKVTIQSQFAAYFQGRNHFLKLQTFPLPPGAKEISHGAVSDENAPAFYEANPTWVITERDGNFKLLSDLRRDNKGSYWPLGPVYDTMHIFIITVYRQGRDFSDDGKTSIWVEIDELAGSFENVVIAYGGEFSDLNLNEAYQFLVFKKNLRFYPIDISKLKTISQPRNEVVNRFKPVMNYLYKSKKLEDNSGDILWEIWNELINGLNHSWQAVGIPEVNYDLVLFPTAG